MVLDGHRNAAYLRALKKVIGPTSRVMDVGAGLGVHGLNTATLGAAKVYLVEPESVIEVARMVATANQLDNVECFPCRVEELKLDEPVDVILSVFTGNFLLTEDLLPSLFQARDRFLAPGGTMIPDRARMEVVPVTATDYYQKHIDGWGNYSEHSTKHCLPILDYSPARSFAVNSLYYDTLENFKATRLAATAPLMELDFTNATNADCDSEIEVKVEQDGICHGWLGWFQMHLVGEWLSTGSDEEPTHWQQVFLPLEHPLEVRAGEVLRFALKRPELGEWTWTTVHREKQQRLSTFLSQPMSPEKMRKASENYSPALSARGEAAIWILGEMTGQQGVGVLARLLMDKFPNVFVNQREALNFVKGMAERYS